MFEEGTIAKCASSVFALSFVFNALAATSADTLPKGVRAGAFVFGSAEGVRDNFNEFGRLESLAHDVNKSITLDDLALYETKLKTLQIALNNLGPQNLGDSLLLADIYAHVDVNERRYVAALLWGITNRFSLGIQVPFVKRDTRASLRVETTNNAEKIKQIVGDVPQIREGLEMLASTNIDTATFMDAIFIENGYEVPQDFSAGGLGDLELEARYGYFKSKFLNMQLRSGIKFPTTKHKPAMTNFLDRPMGEESLTYRFGTHHDFKVLPSLLSINTAVSAVYRRPFVRASAVPKTKEQVLPNLNDPDQIQDLRYDKALQYNAEAGVVVDVYKGALSVSGSYVYSSNGPTRISGGAEGLYYDRMTQNTDSESHTMEFSAEMSSVPLFLGSKMPLPGKFTLTWSQPIGGKNTLYTPYGRFDMVLLF